MRFVSKNPAQTRKIASNIAKKITKRPSKEHAVVIALEGELGAGKTTFVRGFARTLYVSEKIKSPTFLLIKQYALSKENSLPERPMAFGRASKSQVLDYKHLYHIDCYRINSYRELLPLDIKSILKNPYNIILIEWPERIRPLLPKKRITVHLDHLSKYERKVRITI